ncbi:MAG TPA: ATP-binding protein [Terrimicrobiaceae bacterium]
MKSKFVFTSESCRMAEVRHSARKFLKQCDFDESSIELLVLGLDEACTNIIRHAYDHHEKPVRLEMERLRDRVRFVLRDYGRSCDPKCIRSRELADVRPGGVGVYIIRQVFDYVKYEPRRRGTRLILEKKFAKPEVFSNGGH